MSNLSDRFNRWEYQNIALAAVAQCAVLVHRFAVKGNAPQTELVAAVNPLLALDPGSVSDVYPQVADLSLGLRTLQDIFSNERARENAAIVRYTLGMLLLRSKLSADNVMQAKIRERLEVLTPLSVLDEAQAQDPHSDGMVQQDRVFHQLTTLYQDTISTFSYRIQVQGKVDNLKKEDIANRIRGLLLAGIRSAVLWYQLGGRRRRLVFYRRRIQETAGNIRRKLIASV